MTPRVSKRSSPIKLTRRAFVAAGMGTAAAAMARWQIEPDTVLHNGAIDRVLSVFERLQKESAKRDPRFRIEHCTLVNADLIRRDLIVFGGTGCICGPGVHRRVSAAVRDQGATQPLKR